MRNVVQVGIHKDAEWTVLARRNWRTHLDGWSFPMTLPDYLKADETPFQFYGVDVSAASIVFTSQKCAHRENIHWVCVGVSDRHEIRHTPDRYKGSPFYGFQDEMENTFQVFVPAPFLFENLGLSKVEVFAVDADDMEVEIFRGLSKWTVKPEFVVVEVHLPELCVEIEKIFSDANYQVYETDYGRETQTYQFLRHDKF